MAEIKRHQPNIRGSTDINQIDQSIQTADISTLVTIDPFPAIPYEVRSDTGHESTDRNYLLRNTAHNSLQTESLSLYSKQQDNPGRSRNREDTFLTDGQTQDVSHEEAVKTVDDIFEFINDSLQQGNGLSCTLADAENTSIRDAKDVLAQRTPNNGRTEVPSTSLSLSPVNLTLTNESSVNFNRQCPIKESTPIKEMDIFLPEEKTIYLSLNTTSWKGRTPPTHIFDFEDPDLDLNRMELSKEKISNQAMTTPPNMIPNRTSTNGIEIGQQRIERVRKCSSEKTMETGKHFSSIQVKHDPNSDMYQYPQGGKLPDVRRTNQLKEFSEFSSTSDIGKIPFAQNDNRTHVHPGSAKNLSKHVVMDNTLPTSKTGSISLSHSLPETVKSFGKELIVDLPDPRLKTKSDVTKHLTVDNVNNTPTSCTREQRHTSIKEIHEHFQESLLDTVDAKEEFNIFGLVTQANNQKPNSAGSASTKASNNIQVSVSTHENHANTNSIMSRQSSGNHDRHGKAKRDRHSQLHKHNADDDNIKVFVNVNVNMNNSGDNRSSYGSRTPKHTSGIDFSVPMINYQADLSDSTDKSTTNSMVSDDDIGSEFGSSQYLPIVPLSNSPSVTSFDKMHTPFGLSPIPSESNESDSTNRQVDSSFYEDGHKTPTMSEYSIASSDMAIKGPDSDSECRDKKPQKTVSPKRQRDSPKDGSTELKTRKISFEEDDPNSRRDCQAAWREPDYQQRPSVSRSYSQSEQYLMNKRRSKKITTSEPLNGYSLDRNIYLSHLQGDGHDYGLLHNPQQLSGVHSSEENDELTNRRSDEDNDTESTIIRHEFSRYSWHHRCGRSLSLHSEGSKSGRRIRQLSVDIGEEWENVHPRDRRSGTFSEAGSMSSEAFPYRSLRKKSFTNEMLVGTDATTFRDTPSTDTPFDNHSQKTGILLKPEYVIPPDLQLTEEIDSPVASFKEDLHRVQVPKAVIIEVAEAIDEDFYTTPPKTRVLLNNPYNSINQKFHSALHCPCLLFFCFLCCAPAVYWMQRSDYEFDYASEKLSKRYGRRATGLYIAGAMMSILLFSGAIATTYILLQNELMKSSTN